MLRFFIGSRLANGRDLFFEMACNHMLSKTKDTVDVSGPNRYFVFEV